MCSYEKLIASFQIIVGEEIIGDLSPSINTLKRQTSLTINNSDIFLKPQKIRYINNKKSSILGKEESEAKWREFFGLRVKLSLKSQALKKSSFIIGYI